MLYELNRALIADVTESEIVQAIVAQVVRISGATACQILVPSEQGELAVMTSYPPGAVSVPDRQMLAVAQWTLTNRKAAGLGRSRFRIGLPKGMQGDVLKLARRSESVLYVPIATTTRPIGVLEVHDLPDEMEEDRESILTSFANQAALALERGRLSDEAARAALLEQSDELKSTLLAGVSHDLRTPLAVIKAASSSLLDRDVHWSDADRETFVRSIDEETDRLTLMVGNLLDLSRIEGGVLRPEFAWQDVHELIDDVCRRLNARGADVGHRFVAQVVASIPVVCLDYVEIVQVLMNLGENAIKYAGADQETTISASVVDENVQISVRDHGPGLGAGMNRKVFEIFYREKKDVRTSGIGIGLAISEGIVKAHGGRIWAVNATDGPGAVVTFTLPLEGNGRCVDG
jgi:two-component system sensor histidine kinase KdpD